MPGMQQRHSVQWTQSSICFRTAIQLSHQGPVQPLVNGRGAKVRSIQWRGRSRQGMGEDWGVTRHIINTNPVQHGYRFKTFSCEISFGFTITGRMSGPDKANHCCKANAEGFSTSPPLLPPQSPEDLAVKENWESPGPKTDQAWSVPQSAPPSSSGSMIPLSQ